MREHTPRQPRCPPQQDAIALALTRGRCLCRQSQTRPRPLLGHKGIGRRAGSCRLWAAGFEGADIGRRGPWPPTRLTRASVRRGVLPPGWVHPPSDDAILLTIDAAHGRIGPRQPPCPRRPKDRAQRHKAPRRQDMVIRRRGVWAVVPGQISKSSAPESSYRTLANRT